MYLVTIRATEGRLLFTDWREAKELWVIISRIPGLVAVVLMPDHVHLIVGEEGLPYITGALRAWAHRRNHLRGGEGAVWEHGWSPREIQDALHASRLKRYLHLNPCRAGLVRDTLSWAFSTHREFTGLAWPAIRGPDRDPDRFHDYVSRDATVRPEGTKLPPPIGANGVSALGAVAMVPSHRPFRGLEAAELGGRPFPLSAVEAAVSAVTRTPAELLRNRGPSRTLLLRAARLFTGMLATEIADEIGISAATMSRLSTDVDPALRVVQRVLGDPRFTSLEGGDLRCLDGWAQYRNRK